MIRQIQTNGLVYFHPIIAVLSEIREINAKYLKIFYGFYNTEAVKGEHKSTVDIFF